MKNEIIIYQPNELASHIEVRVDEDTVWLNKDQIGVLFNRDRTVIGRHINSIFKEGELDKEVVSAFFALTTQHGAIKGKMQNLNVEYYNLDVIISVGYRVKSKEGTQFRIWANKILKDYLLKGYALNNRMNRIEEHVDSLSKKVKGIDLQIKAALPPSQGLFFDGQIFDAYTFVSELIKSAKQSIVLIDNYVDETVLTLLSKRKKNVSAIIYSSQITKQLKLDLQKHNQQYAPIDLLVFSKSHDRFLIIDEVVYHFGASLKDLGKKWFAFSKMEMTSGEILCRLRI